MNTLRAKKPIRRAIERGHPWIYAESIHASGLLGSVAQLADEAGPLALCFIDPDSPIVARVIGRPGENIDRNWVVAKAVRAATWRKQHPSLSRSNAMRLIHGEGDFCPGLVIDLYADTAVVNYDGAGAHAFWQPRLADLLEGIKGCGFDIARVVERALRGTRGHGVPQGAPDEVVIHEGPNRFAVDVVRGQKTGFFLDQRENRFWLSDQSRGRTVLNVFAYTGGFSLHAVAGGATHVTSVDLAAPATAALHQNIRLSVQPDGRHEVVTADAFAYFAEAARHERQWDIVITDPPSFAKRQQDRASALLAYKRLADAAVAVTKPGGLYVASSCSSHISDLDLRAAIAAAAPGLRIVHSAGAAPDHPTLPGFPEGHYLKFLACSVP